MKVNISFWTLVKKMLIYLEKLKLIINCTVVVMSDVKQRQSYIASFATIEQHRTQPQHYLRQQ